MSEAPKPSGLSLNPAASEWVPSWAAQPAAAAPPPAAAAASPTPSPAAAPTSPAAEPAAPTPPAAASAPAPEAAAPAPAPEEAEEAEPAPAAVAPPPLPTPAAGAGAGADPATETPEAGGDDDGDDGTTGPTGFELDDREHLNVVFIGHVDAGKSTLAGSILYCTGNVDKRTIEKFEREAKERNRESWFLAFIMDTNEEERAKGKTVEVGRAYFATDTKRFTVLDAPGHRNYVPNMIAGAAQADVGVLVISARRGEFETGFERGGQTREHALLAKTLGVRILVVVVNKMDDPTVKWGKDRFDECVGKLTPFFKTAGYNTKRFVQFVPISALTQDNVKDRVSKDVCPWWDGPSLLEALDGLRIGGRDPTAPVRVPVLDQYQDRGVIAMGKVEAGMLTAGDNLIIQPLGVPARVETVLINDTEVPAARPGENVKVKLKGVAEADVNKGYVLCGRPVAPVVDRFVAQLMVLDLEEEEVFSAGKTCILHVHTCAEEVEIEKILCELDKKTGAAKPGHKPFVVGNSACMAQLKTARTVCVDKFEVMQQMGRFTLRDAGRTIAIGKVMKLPRAAVEAAASTGDGSSGGGSGSGR